MIFFFGWTVVNATYVGLALYEAAKGGLGLWCGNSVTDPLGIILNRGVPIAAGALAGLDWLRRKEGRRGRGLLAVMILFLLVTISLVVFGAWFYRTALGNEPTLSEVVWWLFGV